MRRHHREGGQTIVLVALLLVPLLLLAGVVIDGGWAVSRQRSTQNAMDAAANAGAVVLVQNLPLTSRGLAAVRSDADVKAQVDATAITNGVTDPVTAIYTGINGTALSPQVVVGSLPTGAPPPAIAYGVQAAGSIPVNTFFGVIRGITGFLASAKATAVAGQVTTLCPTDGACSFLPVTFPTQLTTCDNTGKQAIGGVNYPPTTTPNAGNETIIALCGSAEGSVGWLDFEPPNPNCNGNGAAELACRIGDPSGISLPLPAWVATQTGNTNSAPVQTSLDAYSGPTVGVYEPGRDLTVQIPIYDCIDNNVVQPSSNHPCPSPPVRGVGANTSYRIVGVLAFILDKSYVNGNGDECGQLPGSPLLVSNGRVGCLKGWLTQIITTGPVGLPTGGNVPNSVWGVQLVR